jgi:hypothetical protein
MKTRFWIFVLLLISGAVLAGYGSGHHEGVRATGSETRKFLNELARATDLQTYLQQHGHHVWASKLLFYGIRPDLHSRISANRAILPGIACVAAGIVGLLNLFRRQHAKAAS